MFYLSWNWTQKWIYYLAYTNVANENCVKFCMKEVFKCRERRMMWWDEEWTKAQAWGCPKHPLLHQQKYLVIFQDTIFLLLHMLCVVLGASLFLFLVFFCFFCCNKLLDPSMFVLERDTLHFHCLEHFSLHSYYSVSVHFLLVLHLALVF
jgi:hypothetical protein